VLDNEYRLTANKLPINFTSKYSCYYPVPAGNWNLLVWFIASDFNSQIQKCYFVEPCALLGYYAASSGNLSSTLSVPSSVLKNSTLLRDSWALKMRPIGCPETSVRNHHYSLRNNPEERRAHLLCGGSLKSRLVLCWYNYVWGMWTVLFYCTRKLSKSKQTAQGTVKASSSLHVLEHSHNYMSNFL
jgi:hypothetical protein